ncbi:MAG: hypothetical protein GXY85_03270 [Candidatus Brocadiaceae bacterium]|nr:hypothetical protein [Candidatus Brocadiaceae bacterium]
MTAADPARNAVARMDPSGPEAPPWVMLLRTGAWLGHPTAPELIGPVHLRAALECFERHHAAHGADLVIDYHHASVVAPAIAGRAPAAGWIRRMELRNGGCELWGRVLWTAEAAAAIGRREFRYLSPVLRFAWPDRVTGRPVPLQIHSLALTNTPFLTELEGLNSNAGDRAGDTAPPDGGRSMPLIDTLAQTLDRTPGQVAGLLGVEAGADDARVAVAVCNAAARVTELEGRPAHTDAARTAAHALGLEPDADATAVNAALIRLREPAATLDAVRALLGLPEEAPGPEVLNAVGALRQARARAEAERVVDEAVRDGRLPPALREFYLREAVRDLEAARQVLNVLPPVLSAPRTGRAHAPAAPDLDEAQQAVCRQLGLSADAFRAAL